MMFGAAKKYRGMILATLLIFLLILTLLGLGSWYTLLSQFKVMKGATHATILWAAAESSARVAEEQLSSAPCKVPATRARFYADASSEAWHARNPCVRSEADLRAESRYVIESLEDEVCGQIQGYKNGVKHYRMTVRSELKDEPNYATILQTTVAEPWEEAPLCTETLHEVRRGRASWRWLA